MALTRPRAYQIYDIDYKQAVRVVTTTNITLSGGAPNTVDGISLVLNNRVLVTGQSTASENGIYFVSTVGSGSNGTWERSIDTNSTGELLSGTIVMVTEGDVYKDTQWKLTTDDPITIGSSDLVFVQNYSANSISSGTSNVVVTSNGAVTISSAGSPNVLTVNSGSISVTANIYPTANITYDLGNTTNRFKDIWLSNGTIYLGNVALSADATSLLVDGTNVVTESGGAISITGNVTGGNIETTGNITGNYFVGSTSETYIEGQDLIRLTVAGTRIYDFSIDTLDADTANIVTTGNVSGTYILGNGSQLTGLPAGYANSDVALYLASGDDTANIITTGNVSGTYILGNVAFATGIPATYGNSNVSDYLASGDNTANIVTTGNVSSGNLSVTGNIVGSYFIGNGSQLTGLPEQYGNSNVADYLASGDDTANIVTTGNVSGTYILGNVAFATGLPDGYANSKVSAYLDSGDDTANIITTGNVSGTYILGNGSQLTGLPDGYANSKVSAYLASGDDTANIVTTGNVSGTYILGNGSQLTGLPEQYGNSNVSAYLASGSDTSNIVTTGNVSGTYILGNGSQLTGLPEQYGNSNVSTYLASGDNTANIVTTGNINVTNGYFTGNIDVLGNINSTNAIVYGNSATFLGDPVSGNNAAYFGVDGYTYLGSNIVIQTTGNANNYSQINFQNINPGTAASTDLVLTADNGNDTAYFMDLGIGSSNYAYEGYSAYYPNDGYLLIDGGNLLLNINTPSKALRVVVGSYEETELILAVDSDGASLTGNLAVSKNINVVGNLTVQGNLQYVNVEDLQIQDPVILIGGGANGDPLTVNDNQDRGSFLAYYTTGRGNAFIGWKNTTGNMIIASDVEFSANNIIQVNNYGTLQTGKIYNGTANADLGNVNTTRVNSVSGYFSGNVDIIGNLNATVGLVYANSGIFLGDAVTGNGAAYAGVPEFTTLGSNVVMQFGGNANSYSQINFQNINSGSEASTDYILTADNGDDESNYIDMGIGSSTYSAASFPAYGPNDGYLLLNGGNLLLNTANTGSVIKFLVGGSDTTDVIATLSNTQLGVTGNISATGNIAGTYFIGNGSLLTGITGGGGGTVSFGNTAPLSPTAGDVWIQANTAVQYVYFDDGTSNQWAEMEAYQAYSTTVTSNSMHVDSFTGDGTTITFTLGVTPASADDVTVNYNGATLLHDSYTVSGADITFGSAPASGYKFDVMTLIPGPAATGATVAGSNTQIQFNDGGSFGASANLTFDKSTDTLNATTVTANGAPLATTGKAIAMAIVFGF